VKHRKPPSGRPVTVKKFENETFQIPTANFGCCQYELGSFDGVAAVASVLLLSSLLLLAVVVVSILLSEVAARVAVEQERRWRYWQY
jgi:hypothetical protein